MGFHLIDPNYQAAIDLMTTRPDALKMERDNRFVRKCRDMGILAALDGLYIFGADSQVSRINLANPGVNTCTLTATPPTFAATGATGNGSNAGFATGFIPSSAGGHWTLNSMSMFIWSNTAGADAAGSNYIMGGGSVNMRLRTSAHNATWRANDNTDPSVANTDGSGLFIGLRRAASGAGAKVLRRNLTTLSSLTTASVGVSTIQIQILGVGGIGFSAKEVMFAGFGENLSDDQCDALYWIGREYGFACGALS